MARAFMPIRCMVLAGAAVAAAAAAADIAARTWSHAGPLDIPGPGAAFLLLTGAMVARTGLRPRTPHPNPFTTSTHAQRPPAPADHPDPPENAGAE